MHMTESEFEQLNFATFKGMTAEAQKATVDRMSNEQFGRWLDRAVPPKTRQSRDTLRASIYAARCESSEH